MIPFVSNYFDVHTNRDLSLDDGLVAVKSIALLVV